MKKLRLEELAVESFTTQEAALDGGTVVANQMSKSWDCHTQCFGCTEFPSDEGSCEGTCYPAVSCNPEVQSCGPDNTCVSGSFTCYCGGAGTLPGTPTCTIQCGYHTEQ